MLRELCYEEIKLPAAEFVSAFPESYKDLCTIIVFYEIDTGDVRHFCQILPRLAYDKQRDAVKH